MTDTAFENATRHKAELMSEREVTRDRLLALDKQIREIENFLDQWRRYAELSVGNRFVIADHTINRGLKATGNSRKEEVAFVARRVILARGEPLMREELYHLLVNQGLTIEGKDPLMVLSTMLWRVRPEIIRLGRNGGYWPGDVEYEPEGFTPARDETKELFERLKRRFNELEAIDNKNEDVMTQYENVKDALRSISDAHPDLIIPFPQ